MCEAWGGLLKEMTDPRSGAGTAQMGLKHDSRQVLKNDRDMAKGHRNPLEQASLPSPTLQLNQSSLNKWPVMLQP